MSFIFINVNHEVGYEQSESIPISLGYILAALKGKGMEGIIIDDVLDRPLTLNALEKWIRRIKPLCIGFTAYQSTMGRIRFLSRYIKSRHRNIKIALGGPQAILMPSHGLEDLEDVDIIAQGEGELVFPLLARRLQAQESLEAVPGIVFRGEHGVTDTNPGPAPPDDLDVYPSPYLTGLLNMEGKDTAITISSRGCSHFCLFCITPGICRGKVRYHSIARTVDEMEFLSRRGVSRFWFADPNFTENRERTVSLMEEKIRRGVGTPFWFQTREDLIDEELLQILKAGGADTVAFGLESGSPGVLKRTNKGIELSRVKRLVKYAQSLGMDAELFSVFGLPGETIDDVRATLDFVKSLDIPIESNSGSQQMQLYFGSTYERNPRKHGFKPNNQYRRAFMSVGEDFETDQMSALDMKKARNIWALANEQMKMDVYYKQRVFEILDFLISNREDLEDQPTYYAYAAMALASIEEYDLLVGFLEGYDRVRKNEDISTGELISYLAFFRETADPAGPMDRVIFDARSWINGMPFTSVSGKYWDVYLGRGLLLESFESGFMGAREGESRDFAFTFPDDYMEEDLQGRTVDVNVKIRKVFKPLQLSSVEEVKNLGQKNHYPFPDLDFLASGNEILYYLALIAAGPENLINTPGHFLMLAHKKAKLGKFEDIREMAALLDGKHSALSALGDTLAAAGKHDSALEYYERAASNKPASVLKRARCLLGMGRGREALDLMSSAPEAPDLDFQETLLQCLKAVNTDTKRIPSLERRVMDLKIEASLSKSGMMVGKGHSATPVIHGYNEFQE